MANKRIKDLSDTATSMDAGDYLVVDAADDKTKKILWSDLSSGLGGGSGTNEYTSEELDITKNTTISESHGLGAVPSLAKGELVCKVAEHGYVVGDVIELGNNWFSDGSPGSSQNNGVSITKSLTEISAVIGDEIQILETTNSTLGPNITIANWKLVLRGYIFSSGSGGSSLSSGETPPSTGDFWYDTINAQLYVKVDGAWVQANA